MVPRPIVLVRERPSLGAASRDLLKTEGYSIRPVASARGARTVLRRPGVEEAVLVVACNGWSSETVTQWSAGTLGERPLVLIGCRDGHTRSSGNLHVVHLPARPSEMLSVVRQAASE